MMSKHRRWAVMLLAAIVAVVMIAPAGTVFGAEPKEDETEARVPFGGFEFKKSQIFQYDTARFTIAMTGDPAEVVANTDAYLAPVGSSDPKSHGIKTKVKLVTNPAIEMPGYNIYEGEWSALFIGQFQAYFFRDDVDSYGFTNGWSDSDPGKILEVGWVCGVVGAENNYFVTHADGSDVTDPNISVDKGRKLRFNVKAESKLNGQTVPIPDNAHVSWDSTDTDIATVENGIVTGVGVGTAKIRCIVGEGGELFRMEFNLTVGEPKFGNFEFDNTEVMLGNPVGFTVGIHPDVEAGAEAYLTQVYSDTGDPRQLPSTVRVPLTRAPSLDADGLHMYRGEWANSVEGAYRAYFYTEDSDNKPHDYWSDEYVSVAWVCGVGELENDYYLTYADGSPLVGEEISVGETFQAYIKAVNRQSGETVAPPQESYIAWNSSNKNVATVNEGLITAVGVGTTRIKCLIAESGDLALLEFDVTVGLIPAEPEYEFSITLDNGSPVIVASVERGAVLQLRLKVVNKNTGQEEALPESKLMVWQSLNENVATVDSSGLVTGIQGDETRIDCVISGFEDGINRKASVQLVVDQIIPGYSYSLTPEESTIYEGGTVQLKAMKTVYTDIPGNYDTSLDVTTRGAWTTENPQVATVSDKGVVTGVSAGVANIVFRIPADLYGTFVLKRQVTVNAGSEPDPETISNFTLEKSAPIILFAGEKLRFTVDITGEPAQVVAGTETYITLLSEASNPKSGIPIALTHVSGITYAGEWTPTEADAPEVWNIHIYGAGGTELHPSDIIFTDKWDEPPLIAYRITPSAVTIFVDDSFKLKVEKWDSQDGDIISDVSSQGTWTSKNTAVATVNSVGLVKGIKAGTAEIEWVSDDNIFKMISHITVNKKDEPPVEKYYPAGDYYLSFADTGFLLDKGASFQLELKGGANREDFTERAVWKSENASVATVSKGLVTGLKAGKVNIVCEIPTDTGGKAVLKCQVTVLGAADDPFDWYDPNPYIPEDQYDWYDEEKFDEWSNDTGKENSGNTGGKNTTVKPTIKKPSKVWGVGSKVSKKRKLTIKWTKLTAKVAGYQIQYREKGKSKWKTKTVSASKSKLNLKKLKKGKRYQIRVRAYIVSSGVKYYGVWSNLKTSKKIRK